MFQQALCISVHCSEQLSKLEHKTSKQVICLYTLKIKVLYWFHEESETCTESFISQKTLIVEEIIRIV